MSTPEMIEKLNALWDEETQCSICLECFNDETRVKTFLDCRHYFCLYCIKECRSLPGSSGKDILCPMCRSKTSCEELARLALATQQPLPLALQQLLQILKSPSTAQQRQQVVNLLRSNPQLMLAYLRQRSTDRAGNSVDRSSEELNDKKASCVSSPNEHRSDNAPFLKRSSLRHPSRCDNQDYRPISRANKSA